MRLFDGIAKSFGSFFGGGTPPPYQTPQRIQNFMQPIPTTEMQAAGHYQNLLDDKQGYDASQQQIDAWNKTLANPDLTDEQRQQATNAVQNWTAYRDAYAQDADNTRKSAAAIGLDVSDYGTDKTLQQSQQAFLTHKNLAVQKFLNDMPTLGELEENRYRELRSRGASPSMANSIVADERGKMNSMLARRLGDFMTTYGKNPDGTIDQDIGIMAMTRVLPDPQSVAQLFAGSFAMPGHVYDTNQQLANHLALADANNAAAMDRTKWSGNNQLLMSREGIAARNEQLAKTLKVQQAEGQANRELQAQIAGANLAVRLAQASGKGGGNKLLDEIRQVAEVQGFRDDLPEEEKNKIWTESAAAVLAQHGIGNKKLKDLFDLKEALTTAGVTDKDQQKILLKSLGWVEDDTSKKGEALESAGNKLRSYFDNIQETAISGDKKAALNYINEVKTLLDGSDYRELFGKKAYDLAKLKVDMYTKLINGEYESNEGKTNYIKDRYFIEYGMYPSGDEIQRIMTGEDFFGVPIKKKVTTPPMKFEVAPPPPGVVISNPGWSSNAYGINPYGGYGQAYTPPPR